MITKSPPKPTTMHMTTIDQAVVVTHKTVFQIFEAIHRSLGGDFTESDVQRSITLWTDYSFITPYGREFVLDLIKGQRQI